jgi:hypothetical protein
MVTHKMLEILGMVARMPINYRRIRKAELKSDYEVHLKPCSHALDAFHLMIEEKTPEQVGPESITCYDFVMSVKKASARPSSGSAVPAIG